MKHLLLTLLIGLPTFLFSQNYSELMAASAGNVYFSTNKNYFITEFLSEPKSQYIFYYKDTVDYTDVYFQNKEEVVGLFSSVQRSIEKKKDIFFRTDLVEYTILNITKNIFKVKVGDKTFSVDLKTSKEILKQFSDTQQILN